MVRVTCRRCERPLGLAEARKGCLVCGDCRFRTSQPVPVTHQTVAGGSCLRPLGRSRRAHYSR